MNAEKKTHWLRNTILILVACGIVGLALTAVQFFGNPDPTTATASIQFTFDGAAEGLAPNGVAYDLRAMASDEVLTEALKAASLDGLYTPEQIRPHLVAQGVYPDDMAAQVMNYESLLNFTASRELTVGDYHPTTFRLALYSDFDPSISQAQLESLLSNILDAYKAYFARVYAYGLDAEATFFTLDDYDYPQQLDIIQERLEMMSGYAQELYEKESSFRANGSGFNDISVKLNNLIDSEISRLNADLTMNALTRDTARLLTQYQFEIRDLNNQLEKQNAQLEKLDALIASYDKNEIIYLSTTDSLTKIDGNSSETYDTLVDRRKEVADGITAINSQITTYELRLSDLLKEKSSTQQTAAAQTSNTAGDSNDESIASDVVSMTEEEIAEAAAEAERQAKAQTALLEKNISSLVSKADAIIVDFKGMLESYNAQEINDLTITASSVRYNAPKLVSGDFAKAAIMTAGPICALGFMLCMVLIIISRKKAEKR